MVGARRSWASATTTFAVGASLLLLPTTKASGAIASGSVSAPEQIALIDHSRSIPRAELIRAARALTYQVNHQLRRFWRVPTVSVRVFARRPPPPVAVITLFGGRPPRRTGGYHILGPSGQLLAGVYLRKWGQDWTVAVSHELLEMLIDPQGESISGDFLEEVCDPVQFLWYRLGHVYVSDFVTPSWFTAGAGPWDLARRLRSPQSFARGGEEDNHSLGYWTWIGPGAHMKKDPRPIKLGEIR